MNRETVGATPALTIDGDLDAETGDIDTNQAVRIGGSVLPSLAIKAGGTVDIAGEVQTGARIDAQGDVSAGSLTGALVRAGGRLVVGDPDLGDGSIVGGEAYAVTALNVNGSVGSRGTTPTTAGIMSDPVIVARLAKAREGIEFCQRDILRIFRTLDLQSIDKAQVQALFQRLTPNKKPFAIALLKQLNQLAGVRDECARNVRSRRIGMPGSSRMPDSPYRLRPSPGPGSAWARATFSSRKIFSPPLFSSLMASLPWTAHDRRPFGETTT